MLGAHQLTSLPFTDCKFFKDFLTHEFCLERLLFWVEAEEFKRTPQSQFLGQRARKLYRKYLSPDSRMRIEIPDEIRKEVEEKLSEPTPLLYQRAQQNVYDFMTEVLWPKFLKSAFWAELRHLVEKDEDEMEDEMNDSVAANGKKRRRSTVAFLNVTAGEFETLNDLLSNPCGCSYFKAFCEKT